MGNLAKCASSAAGLAAAAAIPGAFFLQLLACSANVAPRAPMAPIGTQPPAPSAPGGTLPGGLMVNCAASPHMCGYPDATNTGVPASAQLRLVPDQVSSGPGWKYDTRGWVEVYGSGVTLSNLLIPTNLDVSASHVTINNVKVVETGQGIGISLRHTSDVLIEHSEVSSPYLLGPNRLQVGIKDVYGDSANTTIEYDNIWNTSTGIQLGEGTVTDNYVHDLGFTSGDHLNGIVSDATQAALSITHNTVFNPLDQTDAIALFEDFGPQTQATISRNLVAGGGYTIYGGANAGKWTPSHIIITDNRFARTYAPNGGYYGPYTAVESGVAGDVWSGNVWDSTLQPVPWVP